MSAFCVGAVGELLVEFVCDQTDTHHRSPARYAGPFPSGAPGIFIDQAARVAASLGGRTVFAGAVGQDAFGTVILQRLQQAGVDPALIRVHPALPTGTAHVAYASDGSRDFVFNIAQSAAACLPPATEIVQGFLAAQISLLHISGSMLGDPAMRAIALTLCAQLRAKGVALSVDPNIRAELMTDGGYLASVRSLLDMASYVLPSDADADVLFPGAAFDEWSGRLLGAGAQAVVLKRGAQGCIGRTRAGTVSLAAHPVTVVDPTGAGDCFCATFVTLMLAGQPLDKALASANAAGALAVSRLGPMEGNSSLAQIEAQRAMAC